MGERLELGGQHVALLVGESSSSSRRSAIDSRSNRASASIANSGSCGTRQRLAHAVDEPVPAAPRDRVALARSSPDAALGADVPARPPRRRLRAATAQARARDLRPRVRLVPVHPGAAVLDRRPVPSPTVQVRPPSRSRASSSSDRPAPQRRLAGRGDAGEAAADDDYVVHARAPSPAAARRPSPTARRSRIDRDRSGRSDTSTGLSSISSSDSLEQQLADPLPPAAPPRPRRTRRRAAAARRAAARRAATRSAALDPRGVGRQRHDRRRRRAARSRSRRGRAPAPGTTASVARRHEQLDPGRAPSARPAPRRRGRQPARAIRANALAHLGVARQPELDAAELRLVLDRRRAQLQRDRAAELAERRHRVVGVGHDPPRRPRRRRRRAAAALASCSGSHSARRPRRRRRAARSRAAIARRRAGSPGGSRIAAARTRARCAARRRPGTPAWANRHAASSSSSSGSVEADHRRRRAGRGAGDDPVADRRPTTRRPRPPSRRAGRRTRAPGRSTGPRRPRSRARPARGASPQIIAV